MDNRLQDLYTFLKASRKFNRAIQKSFYKSCLLPYKSTFDKVFALLYNVYKSQSQPKMDKAAIFFKRIAYKKGNLKSFKALLKTLGATKDTPHTYKSLFDLLSKQPGWGGKTSALFVKAVYDIHINYAKELTFWNDAPDVLSKEDELFLPVDKVIIFIFKTLDFSGCKNTFKSINKFIKEKMPNSSFELWDDLWFWGYITQKVYQGKRIIIYNEEKYWNLLHGHKDDNNLIKIENLANQFITLLNKRNGK